MPGSRDNDRRPAGLGRLVGPLIAGALAAILIASASSSIANSSAVFDETTYLHMSEDVYQRGDFTQLWKLGVAPLPILAAYALPGGVRPSGFRESNKLARASALVLFGVPAVLLVYTWLVREAGRPAAFVGAALLALSPNFIAHASLATTDVCFVATALWSLLALTRYAEDPSRQRLGVLAVALGLAMAAKYGAIGLFPVVGITLLVADAARATSIRQRAIAMGRAAATTSALLVVALAIAWAIHGFAIAKLEARHLGIGLRLPASAYGMAYQIRHAAGGHQGFLLGERRQTGWWYYTPTTLLLKSTPIELLIFGTSLCVFLSERRMRSVGARVWRTTFLIYLALAMTSRVNVGIRYVLLLLPLAVLTATTQLSRLRLSAPRAVGMLAVIALAAQAWSAVSTRPHFISYFNDLVGGRAAGYHYLADSNLDWGQDLPALQQTLEQIGAAHPLVAYFGTAPFDAYGITAVTWPGTKLDQQAADWLAVSATHLNGVYLDTDPFAAFRTVSPSARAADTIFLYKLDRPEVQSAMRLALEKTAGP